MFKSFDKWFAGYLASALRRPQRQTGLRHLIVAVCDHFEPFRGGTGADEARRITREWIDAYPDAVAGFRDADGYAPRHTFFYPQEEYDAGILDGLAAFCRKGFGEVEIHLHHRHDTPEGLRDKLVAFRDLLHERHGLLGERAESGKRKAESGDQAPGLRPQAADSRGQAEVAYGFIHGNWALCNSRPDGDWCGVNEELGILSQTGCYADFTFPSAPSPTQPRMVNAIYYARDRPGKPRGADRGSRARVSGRNEMVSREGAKDAKRNSLESGPQALKRGNEEGQNMDAPPPFASPRLRVGQYSTPSLMLITGPLALNWKRRKWGVLPRLENSEISGGNPPTLDRARLWVKQAIGVAGRPDWVFVKLHTHGCVPENAKVLLGEKMRGMHTAFQREYNDGVRWQLHYVTAREMYNLVKAAEAGKTGAPGPWRDWLVGRPPAATEGVG